MPQYSPSSPGYGIPPLGSVVTHDDHLRQMTGQVPVHAVSIRTGTSELVDQAEIARRLVVSAEWVRRLYNEGELPLEMGTLGPRKVWRWAPVRDWALRTGRLPVRPRTGSEYVWRGEERGVCEGCGVAIIKLPHPTTIEPPQRIWTHVHGQPATCRAIEINSGGVLRPGAGSR